MALLCLNPCFVGIWSCRHKFQPYGNKETNVLILVLLGYGLVDRQCSLSAQWLTCLNPCFVGIWSCSYHWMGKLTWNSNVLILVLLGYGLVEILKNVRITKETVLILVFVG